MSVVLRGRIAPKQPTLLLLETELDKKTFDEPHQATSLAENSIVIS